VKALQEDNREIWAFHPSNDSISLTLDTAPLPKKLAIVFGKEDTGCSEDVLKVAHRRITFPLFGFSDYYSLSIAAGLVLQNLFQRAPDARGDLTEDQKSNLRKEWYERLASKSERRKEDFAQLLSHPPPPFPDLRRPDSTKTSSYVKKALQKRIHEKERQLEDTTTTDDPPSKRKKD